MGENVTMDKEDILNATINLLEETQVPVKLKEQIADRIAGAVYNMRVVIAIIHKERELDAQQALEEKEKDEEANDVNNLDFGGEEDVGDGAECDNDTASGQADV